MRFLKKLWAFFDGNKRAIGGTVHVATVMLSQKGIISPESAQVALNASASVFGIGMAHYAQKSAKKHLGFDVGKVLNLFKK